MAEEMRQQLQQLTSLVQALTQDLAGQREALAQSEQERQALRQALQESQGKQAELTHAVGNLVQQSQMQQQQAAVTWAQTSPNVAGSAANSGYMRHMDVMKAVKAPQSLKDRDQWERFAFQVETYLAFLDSVSPHPWRLHENPKNSWILMT